ncbi:hypothetical protein KCV87_22300 [Actinosynnema pretiosum subsp. pretiosum]|uniref:DUF5667 domain-containing protein n=1 Tax=Actinosynnema pretiosum subsp. pretiosum TaxID=103721 RepID=A0AA45L3E3_9PSEU|nr:hypothetical protein APASM_6683 [Actinosynnema pretiosum subsp. pretiosum]QUF02218.1 hypothetical protein KCV87_22300 [Actinosynnema pretiosum subsp. pretiosum]
MVGRGITPLGRHGDDEEFARAVEALPEGKADPDFARELAVVEVLRRAAEQGGPDADTRARMRARVLDGMAASIADTAIPEPVTGDADGDVPAGAGSDRGGVTDLGERRRRGGARGRFLVASAAALCLLLSLAGMSVLLSRDALPGDALYGVKRTAEEAQLGLTFAEDGKGFKRLEFAASRLSEVETLAGRGRDTGGGPVAGYLTAFSDFDADASAGARALVAHGTTVDRGALGSLYEWAAAQSHKLDSVRHELPADANARAGGSMELLGRIGMRVVGLLARAECAVVTSGTSDDLGPLPAEQGCEPVGQEPGPTSAAPSSTSSAPVPGTGQVGTGTTGAPRTTGAPTTGAGQPPAVTTTPKAGQPQTDQPGVQLPLPQLTDLLPTLPLPSLQLPLPLELPGLSGILPTG